MTPFHRCTFLFEFKIHAVVKALGFVVNVYTTSYTVPSLKKNLCPVSESFLMVLLLKGFFLE